MKINITSIANAGELSKERVVLVVQEDCNLTNFAVFCCKTSATGFYSGDVPHAYWFASKEVKKGDYVVLYSKKGTRGEKKNANESTSHFFYWQKEQSIFEENRLAVLVLTQDWDNAVRQPSA